MKYLAVFLTLSKPVSNRVTEQNRTTVHNIQGLIKQFTDNKVNKFSMTAM